MTVEVVSASIIHEEVPGCENVFGERGLLCNSADRVNFYNEVGKHLCSDCVKRLGMEKK